MEYTTRRGGYGKRGQLIQATIGQAPETGTARYSEWSLVRRFIGPKIVH